MSQRKVVVKCGSFVEVHRLRWFSGEILRFHITQFIFSQVFYRMDSKQNSCGRASLSKVLCHCVKQDKQFSVHFSKFCWTGEKEILNTHNNINNDNKPIRQHIGIIRR